MTLKDKASMIRVGRLACAVVLMLWAAEVAAQNPVPLINQPLVPDTIRPGAAGFTLTVNGTGFVSGAAVHWNGHARTTTFVSNSQVKAAILSSDVAARGTASVQLVNPTPGGGASNVSFFQVAPTGVKPVLSQSNFSLGALTERNAVGDFNGDGKQDLAVQDPSGVWIMLGNGDGTFQPAVLYSVPGGTEYVITADINNDGKLDIVALGAGIVTILLGNGDGTFQTHIDSALDTSIPNPFTVAAGDFNRDGRLDLVVGYQGGSAISVLLGDGDGTFKPFVDYPAGPDPNAVAVGDFNRDGKLDIVTGNFATFGGKTVSVLLGNGDGTFQPHVDYATDAGPLSVVVADFNGDGKLDLAVDCSCGHSSTCGRPGTVSILLGNGDGTFQPAVNYDADEFPYTVTAGDFNADGKVDLALTDLDSGKISFLLGNGDGTFQPHFELPTNARPVGLVAGDFNGDGALDLVIGGSNPEQVALMLQVGTVALSPSSLSFSSQLLGTVSTVKDVKLTNIGNGSLTISGIAIGGVNATDFNQSNNCPSSLASNAHCTISVKFAPSALGPRIASITVADGAPGSPQSVPLSGIGVTSGPNATLSTSSLTFSTQLLGTTSPAQSVTLSNYGTLTLSITSIASSGDFHQTNTCGAGLAVLGSCTISVTFAPTKIGGRSGAVKITDNAPASPQSVALHGTGTVVELNPASLGWGVVRVGYSGVTQATTLTNIGSTALSITGITIAGTDPGDFLQTNTCGTGVGAGGSCSINVTFVPKAAGARSAYVAISDNGGGSPQHLPLSGTGCVYNTKQRKCLTAPTATISTVQSVISASRSVSVPSPTGPSRIGTRTIQFTDFTREDPFLANGTKRELLVRFWYPTSLDEVCNSAEYASPKVWSLFSELIRLPLPQVATNSCQDAPLVNRAHPVIVFTHGYTGTFTDYTFLFEDLASRGYVVASIDHTYEATAVEFPDGRLVRSMVGSHLVDTWRLDDKTLQQALATRLKDLTFVVDQLERMNTTTGNPFSGRLDTSRIALMGHSFGGEATIVGLQQEPRFKAGVMLDAVLNDAAAGGTDKALLILTAGHEQRTKQECSMWTALKGRRLAVDLTGAEHLAPSDAIWLARGALKTGVMGPDKTIAAIRNYIAAFLDANLRGEEPSALLGARTADSSGVTLTTQDQVLCHDSEQTVTNDRASP